MPVPDDLDFGVSVSEEKVKEFRVSEGEEITYNVSLCGGKRPPAGGMAPIDSTRLAVPVSRLIRRLASRRGARASRRTVRLALASNRDWDSRDYTTMPALQKHRLCPRSPA
jgi:hypothetical protein